MDLVALRAWLGVPATSVDDPALTQVVEAETLLQARACILPADAEGLPLPLNAALLQALYRRAGRELAARNTPLGILGEASEFGPQTLRRWDAEIDRLEGPYRRVVFG